MPSLVFREILRVNVIVSHRCLRRNTDFTIPRTSCRVALNIGNFKSKRHCVTPMLTEKYRFYHSADFQSQILQTTFYRWYTENVRPGVSLSPFCCCCCCCCCASSSSFDTQCIKVPLFPLLFFFLLISFLFLLLAWSGKMIFCSCH